MIFSNKIYKTGKGKNLSAFMPSENQILIYYFGNGINKKQVDISYLNGNLNFNLTKENLELSYDNFIRLNSNFAVVNIDNSISIISI